MKRNLYYAVFTIPPANGTTLHYRAIEGHEVAAGWLSLRDATSELVDTWLPRDRPRVLTLTGNIKNSNDGSNFPWWRWSIADLNLSTDLEAETSHLASALRGDQISNGEPSSARAVLLALLDGEGRVQHGVFELGEIALWGTAASQRDWTPPRNEFQRLVWCTYRRDEATTRAFASIAERLAPATKGIPSGTEACVCFLPRHNERREYLFRSASFGSIGLPHGIHRNPHYRHTIELKSEPFSAMFFFQNDLPDLAGREILFRSNDGFVSNYQEPVGLWCGKSPISWGRPVVEGILRINHLNVSPRTGNVLTIDAEAVFRPDVMVGVPRHRERPRGYMRVSVRK